MSWGLSPRWCLEEGAPAYLHGPGGRYLALDAGQRAALESARGGELAAGHERWVHSLLLERVLVPAHLVVPGGATAEAEDFYRHVFEAYCRALGVPHLWPRVQAGLEAWSGTVLRQPLRAHRAYLPSRPSVCIDLLAGSAPAVRFCVDCREPLLTPWENVLFARRTFSARLRHGAGLFERICDLVFRNPDWFQNPYVKYLHPAVELPSSGGERDSAYWNLGAGTREELWERALAVVEAVGGDVRREQRLRRLLGEQVAPELLGYTMDPGKPAVLKVYHVLYGRDVQALHGLFSCEDYPRGRQALERILADFPLAHPEQSRWIASLYHELGSREGVGMKFHTYLLPEATGRTVRMAEACALAASALGPRAYLVSEPTEHLVLAGGQEVRVRPTVISYMFRRGQGMTGATLYADFVPAAA